MHLVNVHIMDLKVTIVQMNIRTLQKVCFSYIMVMVEYTYR